MSKVEAVREMLCKFGYAIAHGDNPSAGELARRIDALYREGCPKCGETGMIDRLTTTAWRCHCGHEWSTPAEQDTQKCWTCDGTGGVFYTDGSGDYDCAEKPTPCPDCNGTGRQDTQKGEKCME